jgi:hypothetical protein
VGEEEAGEEAEKKTREEEDDLFIYLLTILVNLTSPLVSLS